MTEIKQSIEVKPSSLEGRVEFSWKSVFQGWIQNLKDDVDPAIKGAKMGFFGLHAIPTWMRQYDEGRMSTQKPFLSGLLGLVVAGSSVSAYVAAGKYINETTNSEWGYSMIGVPVTAQGLSWVYEAFLRAKKTELSKVVMTRLERTFDTETQGEYDLTNKAFIETLAANLYKLREEETNEIIESEKTHIEIMKSAKNCEQQDEQARRYELEKTEANIKNLQKSLEKYKPKSLKHARKGLFYVTRNVFNGLVADNQLGKQYKMSTQLQTGPVKRQKDRDLELEMQTWDVDECDIEDRRLHYRFAHQDVVNLAAEIVKETIKSKKGSAKIELFGTITSVYTNDGKEMHYEVAPNASVWKI